MNPEQYDRMWVLFEEAQGLGRTERISFLDESCGSEADLRAELEKLLLRSDTAAMSVRLDGPGPLNVKANWLRPEADSLIGRRIDVYQVESQIGAGGMGLVYLARRCEDYEQKVALKAIRRGMDTDDVLRRFRRERQLLASLNHPNIARLLDGGTVDHRPYFVIEFVDGIPIDRYCVEHHLGIRERLKLFLSVCDAVDHAHRNLVLHRDLKPTNILVDVIGNPKLLDFGIAQLLQEDSADAITKTGEHFATPEYAAPEQLEGDAPLNIGADVYALGVVLYELLTGHRPHERAGAAALDLVRRVCETEPNSPRLWQPRLPRDLETICMKCLCKAPKDRFARVQELADEIRRFLDGKPIQSRRIGVIERSIKWLRRRPMTAALIGVVMMALALLVGIMAWDDVRVNQQRRKSEESERLVAGMLNQLAAILGDDGRNEPPDISDRQLNILQEMAISILSRRSPEGLDPKLQQQLGQVLDKVGAKLHLLGNDTAAKTSLDRGMELQRALCRRFPSELSYQHDLAITLHDSSLVARRDGEYLRSEQLIEEAIALHRNLMNEQPGESSYRVELARHLHQRADLRKGQWGNQPPTEVAYERVIADYAEGRQILQSLIDSERSNRSLKLALAVNYHSSGHAEIRMNRTISDDRAWEHFAAARTLLENLERTDDQVPDYKHELARLFKTMASALRDRKRLDAARPFAERAITLEQPLVDRFPAVLKYRFELAGHLTLLGRILGNDAPSQAEPLFRRAVALRAQLAREAPWRASYHYDYANLLLAMLQSSQDAAQVESWLREAKEHAEIASQIEPSNETYQKLSQKIAEFTSK